MIAFTSPLAARQPTGAAARLCGRFCDRYAPTTPGGTWNWPVSPSEDAERLCISRCLSFARRRPCRISRPRTRGRLTAKITTGT